MTPKASPPAVTDIPAVPADLTDTSLVRHWSSSVHAAVYGMTWLDRVGAVVQSAAGAALDGGATRRRVKSALHGAWLGHPLHPALSDAPMGFYMSSVAVDLAGEDSAAGLLTAAGVAASGVTAWSGIADWTAIEGRDRRLTLFHGLLNVAALGVEVGSLVARISGRRGTARTLNVAGFAATSAAAYLGGSLVFARGIGVDHAAWTHGPEDWTSVMSLQDLPPGATRGIDVEGRRVLLHRTDDGVHAMENACSHAGGPLDEGEVADGTVTCPWHGSCFRLVDGAVLAGPAAYPQLRLQARVSGGRIEVRGRQG